MKYPNNLIESNEYQEFYLKWYDYLIDGFYKYKVFLNDRSYIQALILEDYTNKKMDENKSKYLTTNGLFLNLNEIAEFYKKRGEFPSIMINIDNINYGVEVNFFLDDLETKLINLILGEQQTDTNIDEIKRQLFYAIYINIAIESKKNLLNSYYAKGCCNKKKNSSDIEICRDVNKSMSQNAYLNRFTNLLLPSYQFGETINLDKEIIENNSQFIRTPDNYYSQCYTYMKYIGNDNEIKAILTLRLVNQEEKFNVSPLVFINNLSEEETVMLMNEVIENMNSNGINKEIIKWFRDLYDIEGKIGFNQVLSLIFGNTIIQEFNKKYNVVTSDEDIDDKIEYISRNYNNIDSNTIKKYLKEIVTTEIFTQHKLETILNDNIHHTIDFSKDLNDERKAVYYLEKDAYEKRYDQEKIYKTLSKQSYFSTSRRNEIYSATG